MLILIALILAAIPAVAILYPFVMRGRGHEWLEDEGAPIAELERRWDAALAGLKSAELEFSIGNLDNEDYLWLRQRYMREAAMVMQGMELEEEQEEELLARVEQQIQDVRTRALGPIEPITAVICPSCSSEVSPSQSVCPNCSEQLANGLSGPQINAETAGE
jgi:hypothetical protein